MNVESVWGKIVAGLSSPFEIATVPSNNKIRLWFSVYTDKDNIYVDNAKTHCPSTKMSQPRKITKKDFSTVYSYYQRWTSGERYLRQEVRLLSRNTAYIFALISHFE
ncbi:hypothetical protein E4K67_15165 [Desulfosporosinus fructosivorans]|uniref:Uncharacterized protein n=1 Tax=Desulfosporosinus fructosivorans TaxID=2018669 RepID=A0A4Z0R350_9FIRM|nr:hypothetical protein [Desulfosporosinus fructosivorans]TGE37208.1 hypothetical protein E4K67_15165 [Desulfosporosinus fructosivorans]